MVMHFERPFGSKGTRWISGVRPTLKFSNVLNQLNAILLEKEPKTGPHDAHRLSSMLNVDASILDEIETPRELDPWMEKAKLYRRQLALKTRQCKEIEMIAIDLSNRIEFLLQERADLKQEHLKSLMVSVRKINALNKTSGNLVNDLGSLKKQVTALERRNETCERLNERMIANLNLEITKLRKTLIEKNDEIEQLRFAKRECASAATMANNLKRQSPEIIYLDGYPIELDQMSDLSSGSEVGQREQENKPMLIEPPAKRHQEAQDDLRTRLIASKYTPN